MSKIETETLEQPGSAAPRDGAGRAHVFGAAKANPLGDVRALGTLGQHLGRSMKSVFEPLLRRQPKIVVEPIAIKCFDDYLADRDTGLASFTLVAMPPLGGQALIAIDGAFILEMLDLFFGGTGAVPSPLPAEFTPAAEAIVARCVKGLCAQLEPAWSPIAEIAFSAGRSETNPAMLGHLDGEDQVVIQRFTLSLSENRQTPVDIIYPVAALKPVAPSLGAKAKPKRGADPAWLGGLTRAVMNVKLPVRSVLAEPVIPLSQLMSLKPGDIIPISFGPEIPLLVADNKFARGAVGAANGRAAIRVNRIEQLDEDKK